MKKHQFFKILMKFILKFINERIFSKKIFKVKIKLHNNQKLKKKYEI